jgi:bifunctional DNA-binding transcriptional regulator/antitoxin component of YhaV-PrlF toxin-antitoxin module
MGRRKVEKQNVRSLTRNSGGKSYVITLPVGVVRRWRWKHRQKLQLTVDDRRKRIIIADWKK